MIAILSHLMRTYRTRFWYGIDTDAGNKREDWEECWNMDWCCHGNVIEFTYWAYLNDPTTK